MDRGVVGRFRDNHPVAIEDGVGEALCRRRGIGDGDHRRLGLAQLAQDYPGRTQDLPPLRNGLVDGRKSHPVAPLHEIIRVLEHRSRPAEGGDEFLRPDTTVSVGVDEGSGLGIELDARGRTGQRDPKLLVQLVQVHQVGSGLELDLIEPAGSKELPGVRFPGCGGGRSLHVRTAALVTTYTR